MRCVDVAVVGGGDPRLDRRRLPGASRANRPGGGRASEAGGRARTVKRNGATLNLGAHALYFGGEAEACLRELDIELSGAFPPLTGSLVRDGRLHPLPGSLGSILRSRVLTGRARWEAVRLLLRLARRNPAPDGAHAVCRTASYVPDPDVQAASSALVLLRRAVTGKAFYVAGGWGSIVRALREQAERRGAVVVTGGGRVQALPRRITGAERIARFFTAIRPELPPDLRPAPREINGRPVLSFTPAIASSPP